MIPINSIMTRSVIAVREDTPILEAMELLVKNAISGMPVTDGEGFLKGMLTEKDVIEILLKKDFDGNDVVGSYMSRNITSFSEDVDAVDICKFFMKNSYRRVPILKDGKIVGIVSRRDIIELILEAKSKLSEQHRYH